MVRRTENSKNYCNFWKIPHLNKPESRIHDVEELIVQLDDRRRQTGIRDRHSSRNQKAHDEGDKNGYGSTSSTHRSAKIEFEVSKQKLCVKLKKSILSYGSTRFTRLLA